MPRRRQPKPRALTKEEVDLLGRLRRGERKRGRMRAAVSLVTRGYAEWEEPSGQVVLTPEGQLIAEKLWPGVPSAAPQRAAEEISLPDSVDISRQIALTLPLQVPSRPAPVDALMRVLGHEPGAEQLANVVLEHYPHGRGLSLASHKTLQALGLSRQHAEAITAAFALARACHVDPERLGERLDGPEDMARAVFVSQDVAALEVEHFWVVALDAARRIVTITTIAQGNLSRVDFGIREVFVPLFRARAAAFYVAHNHPSADLRWSVSDVRLTQRLSAMALPLGFEFLDHLIISPTGKFVSLEQGGVLDGHTLPR